MIRRMIQLVPALVAAFHLHAAVGVFENHADVGTVLHPGSVQYDAASRIYTVSGSGENMWFATDDFHFVWKRMSGDAEISADIAILGDGGDPHRKAVLMIRQSLDTDSAYADAAVHGNGLTSLQVRAETGDATHEIESNVSAPHRVSIVKQGDLFRILVDGQVAGGSMRANISGTYYVGIGVCAHNKDAIQKVAFSNVEIGTPTSAAPRLYSTLETILVASTDRRVVYVTPGELRSPVWAASGDAILFTVDGHQKTISPSGGTPSDAPEVTATENVPSTSPDGKQTVIVDRSGSDVVLQVKSAAGNENADKVRVLAELPGAKAMIDPPAWSPDGKRLVFVSSQLN